jgi:MFS family permease
MSGFGMIIPLMPVYAQDLGATGSQIGLVIASFYFGRLLMQIPAGLATDRIGRRRVLIAALIGYTVTSLGFATAASPNWLVPFRLLKGSVPGVSA